MSDRFFAPFRNFRKGAFIKKRTATIRFTAFCVHRFFLIFMLVYHWRKKSILLFLPLLKPSLYQEKKEPK
ncbi:MAG: hypothetical protein UW24_C0006G0029 [Parcubacteria group bacterium GW2011_GWA2_44_12]|nr:MAG: hypothetical protein UW24_C0006G0029 [Parcubacteria group bacterium GW2011_GWA2_44_12]